MRRARPGLMMIMFTMAGERSWPDDTARLHRHHRRAILVDDGIDDLVRTMLEIIPAAISISTEDQRTMPVFFWGGLAGHISEYPHPWPS